MIDKIKIYGERNTGTNYLRRLLELNVERAEVCGIYEYGWNHDRPMDRLEALRCENVLFLFMIKNPYSWVLSLKRNTHKTRAHKTRARKELSVQEFLTEPYEYGLPPVSVYSHKVGEYR
jgi:hypothetical protein